MANDEQTPQDIAKTWSPPSAETIAASFEKHQQERDARRLIIDMVKEDPFEGASATWSIGSDSYAYTIVQVLSAKRIVLLANYIDPAARFYFDSFEGKTVDRARTVTRRADGQWVTEGQPGGKKRVGTWTLGVGIDYRDPSY